MCDDNIRNFSLPELKKKRKLIFTWKSASRLLWCSYFNFGL